MKKPWKTTRHQKGREIAISKGMYAEFGAPRAFRRSYEVAFRAFNKQELYRIVQGKHDDCFINSHRHGAAWDYW